MIFQACSGSRSISGRWWRESRADSVCVDTPAGLCRLWPAYQGTRYRAGVLAVLHDDLAADDGRYIASGALEHTAPAGRQVEDDLRRFQLQLVEVDNVEIGFHAHLQGASIIQTDAAGGVVGLHFHRILQLEAVAALPVAHVETEHLRGHTGIAQHATVGAGVGQ